MAFYNHIITPEEVDILARPCTADEDVALNYIEESEMQDIKPIIGDALFFDVANNQDKYKELLDGGMYEAAGQEYGFAGLKRTLAYYAWARMVKCGTHHLTRYGFVNKNGDYSQSVEWRERQAAYNDAYAVADGYMRECLAYLTAKGLMKSQDNVSKISKKRTFFGIIGK